MGIQLKVKNFRCLRDVNWSPDGVCVLVGPNGSGKTTLFDALKFLWFAFNADVGRAVGHSGGSFFRNVDAPLQESVSFSLTRAPLTWEIEFPPESGPFNLSIGERILDGTETIISKRPEEHSGPMTALRALTIIPTEPRAVPLMPMVSTVDGFIIYGGYLLHHLRYNGSQISTEKRLLADGRNAFAVLRGWRDRRETRPAFDFVVEQICRAFPGVSDDLEFEDGGQIISLSLGSKLRSQSKPSIPVIWAPQGWLAGLLHLMAVAGAERGTVVAIDEFENSLHPYAIRRLVKAMREWAAEKQLTVVLAGHSSALLDEFKECPSQVFVMESWRPGQPSMPMRLTDYREPDWLNHFSLGELYRHEEFGGPRNGQAGTVPVSSGSTE